MVIETIAYCVGILSLAAAVFVLSREVVHLRRDFSSLRELVVAPRPDIIKGLRGFNDRLLELSRQFSCHDACVDARLLGLRAMLLNLQSISARERRICVRRCDVIKRLKRLGRLSK